MTLKRISLAAASALISKRTPFNAGNVYAAQEGDCYVVYSFGTHWPLYVFLKGKWYENVDPATATTNKHRRLCRPPEQTCQTNLTCMRNLIAHGTLD